jgi:glycerol kinase
MQFQADITGVPVVRPEVTETTALGAAYLAGLATGFWSGLQEISDLWRAERRFEPAMQASQRDELIARWHKAVERSRHWAA